MAVSAVRITDQIRERMLAKQRKRKRVTITTTPYSSMEDKVQAIKQARWKKRKQIRWKAKSTLQKAFGLHLDSSFISELHWLPAGKVHVKLSGKEYTIKGVSEAEFNSWYKGFASCRTDDPTGAQRWYFAKSPSLGAYYNHYIKKKYTWSNGWV